MDIRQGVVVSRTNLVDSKKEKPSHWKAAFAIIFASILAWGGAFGYEKYMEMQINKLDDELKGLEGNRNYKKIALVADIENRLEQSQSVLKDRPDWGNFFKKLEDSTLPEVTFNKMDTQNKDDSSLSSKDKSSQRTRVTLKGTTIGIKNITKQVNALKGAAAMKEESVLAESVRIENIEIKNEGATGEQTVEFTLEIIVNPQILKNNPFLKKENVKPRL